MALVLILVVLNLMMGCWTWPFAAKLQIEAKSVLSGPRQERVSWLAAICTAFGEICGHVRSFARFQRNGQFRGQGAFLEGLTYPLST